MHQTFYIDVDEEITSVVERIRKAAANEIIMVVPKRALLIQSIVNLRLLKKEAESRGVQLMIVTQDKLGKLLVEKAGILVQQKLDEGLDEEVIIPTGPVSRTYVENNDLEPNKEAIKSSVPSRLEKLGSDSYFDENAQLKNYPKDDFPVNIKKEESIPASESIVGKELVTGIGSDIKRMPKGAMSVSPIEEERIRSGDVISLATKETSYPRSAQGILGNDPGRTESLTREPRMPQEKKIEQFFYSNNYNNNQNYNNQALSKEDDYSSENRAK